MTPFDSLILGLVEGFTEFLPISSTAHLILTSYILGLDQSAFVKTFEIAIQSGAILAVIVVYWRKLLNIEILKRITMAFIPTAIIGLILYKTIKEYLIGNIAIVLWALAIGGILLILFEYFFRNRDRNKEINTIDDINLISYKKSILIGMAQSIAVIPGVSRSAATIVGGLLIGLSRRVIVEFSFLLAVPTILAATALDLSKNYSLFAINQISSLSIGFVSAFIMAIIGIKFLLSYIENKTFIAFGVYRIILVIFFIVFLL